MRGPLGGAVVVSAVAGLAGSWLFIAWARRISAEEWVVRGRSFERAHDTTKQFGGLSILRTGSVAGVRMLREGDVALLRLASPDAPATQGDAIRRLALLAGGSAAGVIIVASIGGLATGATWLEVFSPLIALLAAGAVVTGQWVRWRFEVASVRASIRKDLPRLLTGARVLLDSGTANAEHALAPAGGTYAAPPAELRREALRRKEVQREEFEAAVDAVADHYAVGEFHRLSASLRGGHLFGRRLHPPPGDYVQRAATSL